MNSRYDVIKRVIDKRLDYIEKVVKDIVEPVADIGHPEKVLGKRYEEWNREDFMKAKAIYRTDEDALNWLTKKNLQQIQQLEDDVKELENG